MTSKTILSSMRICNSVSKTKMECQTWNMYKYRIQTYIFCSLLSPKKTKREVRDNIFLRSLACRPLLCWCPPFMIYEGCSESNPKSLPWRSGGLYHLSHPSLSNWATHIIHCMSLFCFYFVGGYWLVMYLDLLKDCTVKNVYPNSQILYNSNVVSPPSKQAVVIILSIILLLFLEINACFESQILFFFPCWYL
jgi:hypothetical protein